MAGQLGQIPLHVAEGDARAILVGSLEHIGGNDLGTLDDAHAQIVGGCCPQRVELETPCNRVVGEFGRNRPACEQRPAPSPRNTLHRSDSQKA
jgi:hypothetical protein